MISQIRNSVFIKVLWGLMGLYLLNISVDAADPSPAYLPEDLSFNDQESFIEIVVEKILGYEDAIQEYDDHDTEDHNKKNTIKIDVVAQHLININLNQPAIGTERQKYPDSNASLISNFSKLDTPPPKA